MDQMSYFPVKNREASLLRARRYQLIRRFNLPENALGGHLCVTYHRCGKPTCHCAEERGHPRWTLSYSSEGKKCVEFLRAELAAELRPLVDQGRDVREAVLELLAINLRLLRLWRREQCDRQRQQVRRPAQAKSLKRPSRR